ncbi:hypothetical protein NFI96_009635, partial [Prochilodus magdalenae]
KPCISTGGWVFRLQTMCPGLLFTICPFAFYGVGSAVSGPTDHGPGLNIAYTPDELSLRSHYRLDSSVYNYCRSVGLVRRLRYVHRRSRSRPTLYQTSEASIPTVLTNGRGFWKHLSKFNRGVNVGVLRAVPRATDLPQSSAAPRLLNLGLFNCRSLNEKATLLNDLIGQYHLDLLFQTETWQVPAVDPVSFSTLLKSFSLSLICQHSSTDDAVSLYNESISAVLDILAPLKTRTVPSTHSSPWLTSELQTLKTSGRRLERLCKKTGLQSLDFDQSHSKLVLKYSVESLGP